MLPPSRADRVDCKPVNCPVKKSRRSERGGARRVAGTHVEQVALDVVMAREHEVLFVQVLVLPARPHTLSSHKLTLVSVSMRARALLVQALRVQAELLRETRSLRGCRHVGASA